MYMVGEVMDMVGEGAKGKQNFRNIITLNLIPSFYLFGLLVRRNLT